MSQLLMTEAPRHLIGLCPIGGGVDVSIFQSALMLGDNHFILPNILFGGRIDPIQRTRWIQATPREQVAADAHAWQTQLQHFLQQKLPAYMVPTTYVALDALPLGANGKVDRKALPIPNLGAPSENLIAPETDLEKAISAVLQEMLAIAEIGVEHEFADLGLSSVHIVQFNNRLKERLNRQIPIAAVFHNSTVRRLAQHLAHDDGQTDAHAQDKIAVKTRGEQRAQARLAGRQHQRR
ncbi:MAG: hypothetical protein KGJ80_14325 [Chloroflexota bacterium]|nr:hypothetical protein [Chloroflexota bacterium]